MNSVNRSLAFPPEEGGYPYTPTALPVGKEPGTHCGRHSRSEGFGKNEKKYAHCPWRRW